jgi:hypothetical protein
MFHSLFFSSRCVQSLFKIAALILFGYAIAAVSSEDSTSNSEFPSRNSDVSFVDKRTNYSRPPGDNPSSRKSFARYSEQDDT